MFMFFVTWTIHALAWFTIYGIGSAVGNARPAPPVKVLLAYSLMTSVLQYLIVWYEGML